MPKEITHWLVAQQVAASLHDTPAGEAAKAFPNCLLLGAILHDAPYYARGHWRETMAVIADAIHGKGHDVFALIENLAATTLKTRKSGPATALLIGMISHIATDNCFHPLITQETGNYKDPDHRRRTRAVQLHRRFETILDVYFAGTLENVRTFSLKKILRECESDIFALVRDAFMQTAREFDCPGLPEGMLSSLKNFARMQSVYANPLITRILQTLNPCLPSGMREITSLFYLPRFCSMAPKLHDQWTLPAPEAGEQCTITLRELYQKSVQRAIDLSRNMLPALGSLPVTEQPLSDHPENSVTEQCSEPVEPDDPGRQPATSDDPSKNSFTDLHSDHEEPGNA